MSVTLQILTTKQKGDIEHHSTSPFCLRFGAKAPLFLASRFRAEIFVWTGVAVLGTAERPNGNSKQKNRINSYADENRFVNTDNKAKRRYRASLYISFLLAGLNLLRQI